MTAAHAFQPRGDCLWCDGTGYTLPGQPCTCTARPFDPDERAPLALVATPPPAGASGDDLDDLALAIARLQLWTDRYLPDLIRLTHWAPYLERGGPATIVALRLLDAVLDVHTGIGDLGPILADLRAAAQAVTK